MKIEISVLNTNTVTNETSIKEFVISDGEWEPSDIEIPSLGGKEAKTMNEFYNAFIFLSDGFGKAIKLSENLDFENDIENIFPIYTATDRKKRKRGFIYDFKEKDGIKTRVILIAPKNYLPSLL